MEYESVCLSFIYVVPVSRNEEWLMVLDKPHLMAVLRDFVSLIVSTFRFDQIPSLFDQ